MTTELARTEDHDLTAADPEAAAGALAHILATGDLAKLSNEQRVAYYLDYCRSLSLNPRSRPFDWLLLDGKLVLYPNKSCAEQLRRQHQIRIRITRAEPIGGNTDDPMFVVKVEGTTPNGRYDESTKYVPLTAIGRDGKRYRLSGQPLANAYAKAETGAKRRLVLSMVGLASPPDPEDVGGARYVVVDGSGRMLDAPTAGQQALADDPRLAAAIGEPTYESTAAASPESAGLFEGAADQMARPDELEPPKRSEPRPSFRASDADVKRWLGAWFATVKGLSLDSDEARAEYVTRWTHDVLEDWPAGKRTDSLRTMFARMTAAEAGDFLAHVRALMEGERAAILAHGYAAADQADEDPDEEPF